MTAPLTDQRTSLDAALGHLSAEPAIWSRVAVTLDDNGVWSVRLLELVSGPEAPPSWEPQTWDYPRARFAARADSGDVVAEWLRVGRVPVREDEAGLPELSGSVSWERRQSRSPAPYETLAWPVTESTLSMSTSTPGDPSGHLVSASDAPSFVNFYAAAACFFWLDRQPVGGSLHQGVMYRHQDARGRINRVSISGEEVTVEVEGDTLDGMMVELAGDVPGRFERVWDRPTRGSDRVRFPLSEGLPPGAWVLLRHGSEWIDKRFLGVPWTRGHEAGVEVIIEPATKLEAFLADREGPQVEFKRHVPTDDDGKAKVMKTVCAFANGQGGSILFGVDDDHNLIGVPAQRVDGLKDQLTQMVGSWVHPRPDAGFDVMPTTNRDVAVLELAIASGSALYGCGRPGAEAPVVYIRHHATTVPARPHEIEWIVRSRTPGGTAAPWSSH